MESQNYIVQCDKETREAPTFDGAVRAGNQLRDFWGLPVEIYHPDGHIMATITGCFDSAPEDE